MLEDLVCGSAGLGMLGIGARPSPYAGLSLPIQASQKCREALGKSSNLPLATEVCVQAASQHAQIDNSAQMHWMRVALDLGHTPSFWHAITPAPIVLASQHP
jgi:hypothetical protein